MNSVLSFITWDIDPAIFEIGPLPIRYYGLLWALSFIVGFYLVKKLFINENESEELADPLLYSVILGGVLGARLGHVIFYQWELFSEDFFSVFLPFSFKDGFRFTGFSGLASHGGTIGIIIALLWYKIKKIERSYLWILDKVAVPTALACFFIRMANFMNSEIVGNYTGTDYGIVFANRIIGRNPVTGVLISETLPRHPAQLYEAGFYLLIFALLWLMYWKGKAYLKEGLLLGTFLVTLFSSRFFVENFKISQGGIESFVLDNQFSTGQLLSVPFVLGGVFFIVRAMRKKTNIETTL
jgi:prolipoprotein diacylglyceryl transferase